MEKVTDNSADNNLVFTFLFCLTHVIKKDKFWLICYTYFCSYNSSIKSFYINAKFCKHLFTFCSKISFQHRPL